MPTELIIRIIQGLQLSIKNFAVQSEFCYKIKRKIGYELRYIDLLIQISDLVCILEIKTGAIEKKAEKQLKLL